MMPEVPAGVPPKLDQAARNNMDSDAVLLQGDRLLHANNFADGVVGELGLVAATLIWASVCFMLVYLSLDYGKTEYSLRSI